MKKYAQKRTVRVQKMGKWGFVPKVWVALLATLISISLFVSCENTAGGGSSKSSAGGRDASSNSKPNNYVFIDGGFKVASVLKVDEVSFADIKKNTSLDVDYVVGDYGFLGWYIQDDSTEALVGDSDLFSESTIFVAKTDTSKSSPLVAYTFNDKDGSLLETARLRGEVSFADIKKKVGNVLDTFVVGENAFLGWVVDGDTTVVKDTDKYSSATTFVATYEKFKSSIVKDDIKDIVWKSVSDDSYIVFAENDAGEILYFKVSATKTVEEVKSIKNRYALLSSILADAVNEYKKTHNDDKPKKVNGVYPNGGDTKTLYTAQKNLNDYIAEQGLNINEDAIILLYKDLDIGYDNAFGDVYALMGMTDIGPYWLNPQGTAILDAAGNILYEKK